MIEGGDSIVIGAPGGLAFWSFEVLRALAKKNRLGPIEISMIGVGKPVPEAAEKATGRILLTNYPSAEFIDAIEQKDVRILYLSESPAGIVNYLRVATKRSTIEAVRICSASYAANLALRGAKNAIVLDRGLDITVADAIGAICQHLGLAVDAGDIEAYATHVAPETPKKGALNAAVMRFLPTADNSGSDISDDDNLAGELVPVILEPLAALVTESDVRPIVWPWRAFYSAELPTQPASDVVHLIGPARMLYHGPYLHLPSGRYEAEIIVAIAEQDADTSFRIEVHAGEACLVRARFKSRQSGRFSGKFAFTHAYVGAEVQVQIITERGSINGRFSLLQISFMPKFG